MDAAAPKVSLMLHFLHGEARQAQQNGSLSGRGGRHMELKKTELKKVELKAVRLKKVQALGLQADGGWMGGQTQSKGGKGNVQAQQWLLWYVIFSIPVVWRDTC